MDIAEQVAVIFCGVRGFLDKVAPQDITDFEEKFTQYIRNTQQPLLESIRKDGQISEANEANLRTLVTEQVDQYLAAKE